MKSSTPAESMFERRNARLLAGELKPECRLRGCSTRRNHLKRAGNRVDRPLRTPREQYFLSLFPPIPVEAVLTANVYPCICDAIHRTAGAKRA